MTVVFICLGGPEDGKLLPCKAAPREGMRAEFMERVILVGPDKPRWIKRPYYELRRLDNVVLMDGQPAFQWHWVEET